MIPWFVAGRSKALSRPDEPTRHSKPPALRYSFQTLCLSALFSTVLLSCERENIGQAMPYSSVSFAALGLSRPANANAGNYSLSKGLFHYDEFYSATPEYLAHYNQREGELTLKEIIPVATGETAQRQFFYQAPFLTNLIRLYLGKKKLWVVTFNRGWIKLHSKPLPQREGYAFETTLFKTYAGAVVLGNKKATEALFENSRLVESAAEVVRLKLRQQLLLLGERGRIKLRRLIVPEKSKQEWHYSDYFLSTNPSWVYLHYEGRKKNASQLMVLKYAFQEKKILHEKRVPLKGTTATKPLFSFYSISPQGQVLTVRYQVKQKTFVFQSHSLENSKVSPLTTLQFPLNAYPAQLRLMLPHTKSHPLTLIGFQIQKDGLQFQTWTLPSAR